MPISDVKRLLCASLVAEIPDSLRQRYERAREYLLSVQAKETT